MAEKNFDGFKIKCLHCGAEQTIYWNGGAWFLSDGKIKTEFSHDGDDFEGFRCDCGNYAVDI